MKIVVLAAVAPEKQNACYGDKYLGKSSLRVRKMPLEGKGHSKIKAQGVNVAMLSLSAQL
jgi:hypothetical protein